MATRRARRREEKQERRAELMAAAERVLSRRPYPEITIAEVAREAGVAKSTVFLYFSTRESLFLVVLESLLMEFFAELTEGHQEGRSKGTAAQGGRWLAAVVERQALLSRLLVFLPQIEANVEEAPLLRFREFLYGHLLLAGDFLEERLAFLGPGDGPRWILRALAISSGLRQLTEPATLLREVFRKAELSRLDFRGELIRALAALTTGMSGRESQDASR